MLNGWIKSGNFKKYSHTAPYQKQAVQVFILATAEIELFFFRTIPLAPAYKVLILTGFVVGFIWHITLG